MILQDHVLVLNYKADWASELYTGLCVTCTTLPET